MTGFHFSPRPNRAAEIRWQEWGDEAFARAKSENKPVLLAISAVWCHWCHVMDETTYSTSEVIDAINARFVPVRVDNDQRPDINARYNQGGWPTTAVLTPGGELLKGATYVPPDQMHQLLSQIGAFYGDPANRSAVEERIAEARSRRLAARDGPAQGALKPDIGDRVLSFLDANFDERYGGFGTDQKFPMTNALQFLLDGFARSREPRTRELVQRTLTAMAGGGMYDRVHGGFYRYSTTRDFSVPHFEKMLEDLGGLLLACARASAMFGDPGLGRVAVEVRAYLDAHLWNRRFEAYGGSQDADEEYYRLDSEARVRLPEPYVDPTIYASWNAETARALIVAGPLLAAHGADPDEWTRKGVAVLDTLWDKLLVDGLMCRYYDGAPHIRGLLGDQAWCAWAALSAFEATSDSIWLDRARELVAATDVLFDAAAGRYADRLAADPAPGRLAEPAFPLDDNALMSRVLGKLGALTADAALRERADAVLGAFAGEYRSYGMFAAAYGSAALDRFAPPLDVRIVGTADDERTVALRETARRVAAPPLVVDVVDPSRDAKRVEALGQEPGTEPVAYVCRQNACFARARSDSELEAALSHARV